MKKIIGRQLCLLAITVIFLHSEAVLLAQSNQYIGMSSRSQTYNTKAMTYGDWGETEYFECRINIDYSAKTFRVYNLLMSVDFVNAKWIEEVHPDKIQGDENNLFLFNPKQNERKMKALKIFIQNDGTLKYYLECTDQRIEITSIEEDADLNDIGDITQNLATRKPIYFKNTTSFNIYVSTKLLHQKNDIWHVSPFIKIAPGASEYMGENAEKYFYYYAYCKNTKEKYVIWNGADDYNQIETYGTYGFKKVDVTSEGYTMDFDKWYMDIALPYDYKSIIIGEGVRIRSEPSIKGNIICKVNNSRLVDIDELRFKQDDLGKGPCNAYQWFKVKWEGDSTGWVYGEYIYSGAYDDYDLHTFNLNNEDYRALKYEHPYYPLGYTDQGSLGCDPNSGLILFYSIGRSEHFLVMDNMNGNPTKPLNIVTSCVSATVKRVDQKNNYIYLYVDISYQDSEAKGIYKIVYSNGIFYAIEFKLS